MLMPKNLYMQKAGCNQIAARSRGEYFLFPGKLFNRLTKPCFRCIHINMDANSALFLSRSVILSELIICTAKNFKL